MKTMTARQEKTAARKASAERMAKARAETIAAVVAKACPCCGGGIKFNSSLTGWVQCGQFGADGFRADSTKPACNWQGFTE